MNGTNQPDNNNKTEIDDIKSVCTLKREWEKENSVGIILSNKLKKYLYLYI